MRRNLILCILMVTFIFLLIGSVIYLNDPELFKRKIAVPDSTDNIIMTEYRVCKGKISHSFSADGYVTSNQLDNYISVVSVSYKEDSDFELVRQVGDDFEAGDMICKASGSEKSAEFKGKVVDVLYGGTGKTRKAEIFLLNYEELYISASVCADAYDLISLDTKVFAVINGVEYETCFLKIGYEIINGSIPVKAALPCAVIPGTQCEVVFIPDVQYSGLYVSSQAVFDIGGSYYAFVRSEGDEIKQVSFEAGRRFPVVEEGHTFEYIEVISGLQEDDVLVVEQISDYSDRLEEHLDNG